MVKLNIHQAKTHLSRYLELLKSGEHIVICSRNIPVAEIHALPKDEKKPRRLGLSKGEVEIGDEFFEPLPDEFLKYFG